MKKTFLLILLLLAPVIMADSPARAASGGSISMFAAATDVDKIMQAFTADTGVTVEYIEMSSGEVLTRLRASGGKALADVWYGGGLDSYLAAGGEGFLLPYVSPQRKGIHPRYMDADGYWTGISRNIVEILVNKNVLAAKNLPVPGSFADLARPEYKDEISMSTPAVSGTFYFMIAELLEQYGWDEGWKLLEAIDRNIPYYAKRGAEPANKAAMGEIAVAVAPFDTGYKLRKEGYPLQSVLPSEGAPWYFSPVAILKGARNEKEAKLFVDWILSEKGQEQIAKYAPPAPVRDGIPLTEDVSALGTAKLLESDIIKVSGERARILETWQAKFGSK